MLLSVEKRGRRIFLAHDDTGLPILCAVQRLMDIISDSNGPITIQADMRGSSFPDVHLRKALTEELKRNSNLLAQQVAGWAIVLDSRIVAGCMTAMDWVFQPGFPKKHFQDMDAATSWLSAQLPI